jgi:hypothetical protein
LSEGAFGFIITRHTIRGVLLAFPRSVAYPGPGGFTEVFSITAFTMTVLVSIRLSQLHEIITTFMYSGHEFGDDTLVLNIMVRSTHYLESLYTHPDTLCLSLRSASRL